MSDPGGFGSDNEQGNDFGTGDGSGNRGGMDIMDALMQAYGETMRGVPTAGRFGIPGVLQGLATAMNLGGRATTEYGGPREARGASYGNGYGGGTRGVDATGNSPESGMDAGSGMGFSIEDLINTIVNNGISKAPETEDIYRSPGGSVEGNRRPSRGSMRRMQLPRRGARTGGGEPWRPPIVDDTDFGSGNMLTDFGPGGNSINNTDRPPLTTKPLSVDPMRSLIGLFGAQQQGNALSKLGKFNRQATDETMNRSSGLSNYLTKLINRGDVYGDDEAIGAAVNPRLNKGRDIAFSSLARGGTVPDNLLDLDGLGADIGTRTGAQNVNVRGRIPSVRSRRY